MQSHNKGVKEIDFISLLSPSHGSVAKVHANYLAQAQKPMINNFLSGVL
jgi:hypothetical protein